MADPSLLVQRGVSPIADRDEFFRRWISPLPRNPIYVVFRWNPREEVRPGYLPLLPAPFIFPAR